MDRTAVLPQPTSPSTRTAYPPQQQPQHNTSAGRSRASLTSDGRSRNEFAARRRETSTTGAGVFGDPQDGNSSETWRELLQSTSERHRSQELSSRANEPMNQSSRLYLSRRESDVDSQGSGTSTTSGRKRLYSRAEELPGKRRHPASNNTDGFHTPSRGTSSNPIDLTLSPETPSRHRQPSMNPRQNSSGSILLPQWQPDEDVSNCPVCSTSFGFLYRRHHCRKCGKVVCANCSPHRITIPKQFIVHPPPGISSSPFAALTGLDITSSGVLSGSSPTHAADRRSSTAFSGGEVVRVCNPCVPDPNWSPPPQQLANPLDIRSGLFNTLQLDRQSNHTSPRPLRRFPNALPSVPAHPAGSGSINSPHRYRGVSASDSVSRAHRPVSTNNPLPSLPPQHAFHRSSASVTNSNYSLNTNHYSPFTSTSTLAGAYPGAQRRATVSAASRPLPPPSSSFPRPQIPRPQVAEEDECPVCGRELPPFGPGHDDRPRVAHVESCISQYSGSSSSSRPMGLVSIDPLDPASASAPNAIPPTSGPSGRMLVYRASEKDCAGPNGEELECVICLEEFAIGQELGRLECLCKFHRHCIRDWWSRKGVGSCPTHQVQNL